LPRKNLGFLGKKIIDAAMMGGYDGGMINHRTFPISDNERAHYTTHPLESLESITIDSNMRNAQREMLIMLDDSDDMILDACIDDSLNILDLRRSLIALRSLNREQLTEFALNHSLCPLHLIDYAICFDDDDAECAAIREIHPSHDT
jgi:hypothetical protein